ncbi:hypothetical protein [Actinomadura sp. RB99]|uniref:hypothetical protein n=1 Tax=Actinomadura sp. RB99 TaxID=2691577 RepID=UPI0016876999|nr:hypothetical protein [Actinomadura sp. RB99]
MQRQRSALAAKFVAVYDHSFWEDAGLNGVAHMEHSILGGVWAQSTGTLAGHSSTKSSTRSVTPPHPRRPTPAVGAPTRGPRDTSPRGRPGDVMGVGPLHGKSEPPFYVCGSDQWLSGHMEGAVRTGRSVAREILASR